MEVVQAGFFIICAAISVGIIIVRHHARVTRRQRLAGARLVTKDASARVLPRADPDHAPAIDLRPEEHGDRRHHDRRRAVRTSGDPLESAQRAE